VNVKSVEGVNGQLHHSDSTKDLLFSSVHLLVDENSNVVPTFVTGRDGLPLLIVLC